MFARLPSRVSLRFVVLAAALAAGGLIPQSAKAAELDKLDAALKLIPADAAFYTSILRNREKFDAIRGSNAWAKLVAMPIVQRGLAFYQMQAATPGSRVAMLDSAMKNPETRKIVDLLRDMVADEVFLYGDTNFVDFMKLAQDVAGEVRYGPAVLELTGQSKGRTPTQLQVAAVISALARHADLIDVPNLLAGFKLKNPDLAKEQLIKMEAIANIMLQSNDQMKDRFKKTKVGEYEYLVLELDGGMVPWDELPVDKFKELEQKEGDVQKVVDRLKKSKLVIALGLRDNYLLASIGSSLKCLEKLGQGDRLVDRPELKPLDKYLDKRLASIGYMSQSMQRQVNNQGKNVDDLRAFADQLLPQAKQLSDEQRARVRKDVEALAQDVKGLLPELGGAMAVGFITDRGIEGYQYTWGTHPFLDGSKPLGLLQHVGGRPILGIVGRGKVDAKDPKRYDMLVKWAKVVYGYVEEFGLPSLQPHEREQAKKFLDAVVPLLQRLDKTNREMLIPALADGQAALVLDAKLESKHFVESLPATEKLMPMAEPAIVVGVSDAKLLKQAFGEYRTIANGLIDVARQIEDANVPESVQVPAPQISESSQGTIYSFLLPKEWGVDAKIVPNIGVGKDAAVLSASQGHTERLLQATPPALGGVLEKADRPLAAAVWIDWAALLTAGTPWVEFGAEQAMTAKGVSDSDRQPIVDQIHTGLDVLKALQSISDESYLEDGVLVNHTLVEIHDVEK
jgi:hypothetical protein